MELYYQLIIITIIIIIIIILSGTFKNRVVFKVLWQKKQKQEDDITE